VCPNCHAMLHQGRPALAIGELELLLRANRATR
jgi:predicted HNH restriction endonuclease